ncbi:MAG: Serum paraoxonase/arylesterase 2 [Sclerophora amabilis]|nr:MAG: Serum paraoxonase/arylesterase 2 [Sclerophora amabilis]
MALVGMAQFLYPVLKRSWTLLGKQRDWDSYLTTLNDISPICATAHPDLLNGCADMKLHGRTIFATCLSRESNGKHRRWYSPQSALRDQTLEQPKDELVVWDLDTDKVTFLDLQGYPDIEDRSFHGLDVLEVSPSLLSIYVINHQAGDSTIAKFSYQPLNEHVTYVASFSNPSLVPNPHSIFAVPGEDAKSAFYVTSDHAHRDGYRRIAETVMQLNSGAMVYHSDTTGWKTVTRSLPGLSTIAGLKDTNSKRLFVAGSTGGSVHAFDRTVIGEDLSVSEARLAEGNLTFVQRIILDFVPSGLALDQPAGEDLYIAGLPSPVGFLAHHGVGLQDFVKDFMTHYGAGELLSWIGYDGPVKRPAVASLVARIGTGQLGDKFFGGGTDEKQDEDSESSAKTAGYTSNPVVEELFVDPYGVLVNGSYSIAFESAKPGGKGDLFVSGLSSKGILRCKDIGF